MQLITFFSAASAMVAGAAASAVTLNEECDTNKAYARVINRCDYDVHLWSVFKGDGCPTDQMVTLKKGEIYNENLQNPKGAATGISIKISKEQECKGNDIVQLEYFLEQNSPGFNYNYLDVSYVDCTGGNCPTKEEGYYLVSGNQIGVAKASAANTWCPVLSCHDAVSCAKLSYINPDDVQTKTCNPDQNMEFYMCGGEAPTDDYESTPKEPSTSASAISTKQAKSSTSMPAPSPTSVEDAYTEEIKVAAAAVTTAPKAKEVEKANSKLTKTKVVYVTAYEYVNAKRHAHDHARRHQPFHA